MSDAAATVDRAALDAVLRAHGETAPDRLLAALWAVAIHFAAGDADVRLALRGPGERGEAGWEVRPGDTLAQLAARFAADPGTRTAPYRLRLGGAAPRAVAEGAAVEIDGDPRGDGTVRVAAADPLLACVLVDVFGRLVRAAAARPHGPVGGWALADEAEAGALPWRGPVHAVDPASTLHGLLFRQAERTPDAPALRAAGETLSYRQAAARAAALAHRLRDAGVRPGDAVGVFADRSPATPVALYGILAAGAAYVPLDAGSPPARLAHMLRSAGVRLVLAGDPAQAACAPGVPAWELGRAWTHPREGPPREGSGGDLCYVLFTSGSTGVPKGVMVEHRSVVNRLAWMQRRYALGTADVLLQKTPATFDVSVWELFWWAQAGASLSLLPAGDERLPHAIVAAVEAAGVTVAHFIPSFLDLFLAHVQRHGEAARLASLRRVFTSGEALSSATVRRFAEVLGGNGTALTNLYGPTETTVDVTWHDCRLDAVPERIPIGRPIDNTRLYVRRYGLAVPPGVPGTLFVGGDGVARGYAGRPAQTAAAFVPEPGVPGGVMYDTGDLVRWLPEGEVDFLGRRDLQIKVNGMRVEVEEIEQVALLHPQVEACAVAPWRPSAHVLLLVAFVVPAGGGGAPDLKAHFAERLPHHMRPVRWATVPELPRTPSGKIDRRRLLDPAFLESAGIP